MNYEELGIEIFYRYKVDSDKINKLKILYNHVLEIRIPENVDEMSEDEFRKGVLLKFPRRFLVAKGSYNNTWNQEQLILKEQELKNMINK